MGILLLGVPDDPAAMAVYQTIQARGKRAWFFDTRWFPGHCRMDLPINEPLHQALHFPKLSINLSEITAVYNRWNRGAGIPFPLYLEQDSPDRDAAEQQYWNLESALGSFLRHIPGRWVNPLEATERIRYKGEQLLRLQQGGIRVPRTLLSNNPNAIQQFYEAQEGEVVIKAPRGWQPAQKMTPDNLKLDNHPQLQWGCYQYQEVIAGRNIRIYVIGESCMSVAITSKTLDYREDQSATRTTISITPAVTEMALKTAKLLGFCFTAIDCKETPAGELVVLEANASPFFVLDEDLAGVNIREPLAELLISHESPP